MKLQGSDLVRNYYQFGTSLEVHIANSGKSGTLCGVAMLSSNYASRKSEIDCPECLAQYRKELKFS